ncbi:MAG TPA: CBS domain-containing protein [Streptosporangiaceae bacterium]|nr:CBS domain-containing protein [Streptosporangiaceae bacterium]
MPSRDAHLDVMLRHLGAAYYESLHGRASAADVARARAAIEERLAEQPHITSHPRQGGKYAGTPPDQAHHHGRWHSTVRDVMTTNVVTVDRITPYKEIATLLTKHKISAVPVLTMGRHVAGVVSEADLLTAHDQAAHRAHAGKAGLLPWSHHADAPHPALIAEELMTAPAITIHPDAPIPRAAGLMHSRQVKRLPVIGPDGSLIGIVSRRDLLSVFLRPDTQIAAEVGELLSEILFADPASVAVAVHGGVVTLTGQPGDEDQHGLIQVAVRLIWDIDGVVDVIAKLAAPAAAS